MGVMHMTREHRIHWFKEFTRRLHVVLDKEFNLVCQTRMSDDHLNEIRTAVRRYIHVCFGNDRESGSDEQLLQKLDTVSHELANRTPNGIVY